MKKIILSFIAMILIFPSCYAETIKLKNGKTIEAKIIEKTDRYIKIDLQGVSLTYYLDEIESIDGIGSSEAKEQTRLPQTNSDKSSSSGIDREHIRQLLKKLGYPEQSWPEIERELTGFLNKIEFSRLKQQAIQVKSNPKQLKEFVSQISEIFTQYGFLDKQTPHSLMKMLTNVGNDDIFHLIDTSPITLKEKEWFKKEVVSCSTITQLGSIILDLLDIDVKVIYAPMHVFNCIPLEDGRVLFVDFLNRVFEIVDINQYYQFEGQYQVLKEQYRVNSDKVRQIIQQSLRERQPYPLKELLNFIYFYIYITDDHSSTPFIYLNRGAAYVYKGDLDQAIDNFSQALRINPNLAEAYQNRASAYFGKGDYNQAIDDYTQALRINPNLAEAYSNRATAYLYPGEYSKAWDDVHKAQALGYQVNPILLQNLRNASGRNR